MPGRGGRERPAVSCIQRARASRLPSFEASATAAATHRPRTRCHKHPAQSSNPADPARHHVTQWARGRVRDQETCGEARGKYSQQSSKFATVHYIRHSTLYLFLHAPWVLYYNVGSFIRMCSIRCMKRRHIDCVLLGVFFYSMNTMCFLLMGGWSLFFFGFFLLGA